MDSTQEAAIGIAAFVVFVIFLPWLRLGWVGISTCWVRGCNVQLNKQWGKPNRKEVDNLRLKARLDLLRTFQNAGVYSMTPSVLKEAGVAVEWEESMASRVVPPVSSVWLGLLVILEAWQYVALPFASGVGWNKSSKWGWVPKILDMGLPQHNTPRAYRVIIWLVLAPSLVAIFHISLSILLGASAKIAWQLKGLCSHQLHDRLADAFMRVLKFGMGLFTHTREMFVEFLALFFFAAALMVLGCSGRDGNMQVQPNVQCWKATLHMVYVPLAMVHIVLLFCLLFCNNLPHYSISQIWRTESISIFGPAINPEDYFAKDDHMLFLSHAAEVDPSLIESGLQVFDLNRPVFASGWTVLSGTFKLLLAVAYVFLGNKEGWRWLLLSGCGVAYFCLLVYNMRSRPCTFEWINCARSLGLVAAIWATSCGFLAAALSPDSNLPSVIFTAGACIVFVLIPITFRMAHDSLESEREAGKILRLGLLDAYYKIVALVRLGRVIRAEQPRELAAFASHAHSGFFKLKGNLLDALSKRVGVGMKEWCLWTRQGRGIASDVLGGCCGWLLSSESDTISHKEVETSRASPSTLDQFSDSRSTADSKVRSWMETACLIVDPKAEVEMGLCVPMDAYFTLTDGEPKYTGEPSSGSMQDAYVPEHVKQETDKRGAGACSPSPDSGYLTLEVNGGGELCCPHTMSDQDIANTPSQR